MDQNQQNEIDISSDIVRWVKYDDKIKEYTDKCKLVKEEKEKIGIKIMSHVDPNLEKDELPQYSIGALNARIVCNQTNSYEGITNKFLCECFREYFDSEEKAKELLLYIKSKREIKTKMVLKREYMI